MDKFDGTITNNFLVGVYFFFDACLFYQLNDELLTAGFIFHFVNHHIFHTQSLSASDLVVLLSGVWFNDYL